MKIITAILFLRSVEEYGEPPSFWDESVVRSMHKLNDAGDINDRLLTMDSMPTDELQNINDALLMDVEWHIEHGDHVLADFALRAHNEICLYIAAKTGKSAEDEKVGMYRLNVSAKAPGLN